MSCAHSLRVIAHSLCVMWHGRIPSPVPILLPYPSPERVGQQNVSPQPVGIFELGVGGMTFGLSTLPKIVAEGPDDVAGQTLFGSRVSSLTRIIHDEHFS